jgi:hypothetical protein
MYYRRFLAALLLLVLSLPAQTFSQKHPLTTSNELQALFEEYVAAFDSGDTKTAADIVRNLFPTPEQIKLALREDAPQESIDTILAMHERLKPSGRLDERWAPLLRGPDPALTEIEVWGAPTEAIAGDASRWFPGGAVDSAQTILRPGMTFYEVRLKEPGESSGMVFHLFYWDGEGWRMLGPIWRAEVTQRGH